MAIARRLPHVRFNWRQTRSGLLDHAKSLGLVAAIGLLAVLWGVDWGRLVHVENQGAAGVLPLTAGDSLIPLQDAIDMADLFQDEKRAAKAEDLPPQF